MREGNLRRGGRKIRKQDTMVGKNEGISSQLKDLKKFGGALVAERVALGGLVGQVRGRKVGGRSMRKRIRECRQLPFLPL